MKLKSLVIIFLSFLMIGISYDADAQRRKKNRYKKRRGTSKNVSKYRGGPVGYGRFKPYTYIGANLNAGNYYGDLAPLARAASTDISFTRPGFGIYGGYKFHHSLAVRAGLNWVRLYGDDFASDPTSESDLPRYARNLSFRNDIKEFQIGLEIYLLPNHGGYNQRLPLNAYLFIGGAVFLHNPMGKVPDFDYQTNTDPTITGGPEDPNGFQDPNRTFNAAPKAGEWVELRPLGTEGQNLGIKDPYEKYAFSIPVALGAQMRIPRSNFNVGIEFGFRYLFTDYIDDVSGDYINLDAFGTDEAGTLSRIMSDRSSVPFSSTGEARNLNNIRVSSDNSHGYFASGYLGGGTSGTPRGNPTDGDQMFITQIKLTYHINSNGRSRAKFR